MQGYADRIVEGIEFETCKISTVGFLTALREAWITYHSAFTTTRSRRALPLF
jgi:hypothetical protein